MKKIIKKILIFFGLINIFRQIRSLLLILLSYPKWIILKKNKKILLEIGSGNKKGSNGWTTVDLHYGADIIYDLKKGIPLPEATVDEIYASHVLEHISFKDLIVLLEEIYRVLNQNGKFSVCVPDASLYIESYANKQRFLPEVERYQPALVDTGSLMDQINYIAYMDQEHKYLFDKENLVNTLKKVAFKKVELRTFDESIDMKSRDFESIYAIAIK
jgi:predicted SAM-dependent methyltransferase